MHPPLRIDASQREDDSIQLYRRLVRDVCFLYHKLASYRSIIGDLDYASEYNLEYWILLNRIDTGQPDDRFIRGGILILMVAMLQGHFDGSCDWMAKHLTSATHAIASFVPEDEEMWRLSNSVDHGLRLLATTGSRDDRFRADAHWAYNTFVRTYFAENAS